MVHKESSDEKSPVVLYLGFWVERTPKQHIVKLFRFHVLSLLSKSVGLLDCRTIEP